MARLFPKPNVTGAPLGVTNYTRTGGSLVNKDTYSFRVDHHFTEANRIFARYSYDDTPFVRDPAYGQQFRNVSPTAGPQVYTRWNSVVEDTHTFSPTLLATFRYSVSRLINNRHSYSEGFDITSIGLPAYMREGMVEPLSFPAVTITGYSRSSSAPNLLVGGLIGATDLIRFGHTTQSAQGNLTKSLTNHTFKFGGEFRSIQLNAQQTNDRATNFSFTPVWTQGPNPTKSSAVAGLGLATFLLGIPGGGVNPAPSLALTTKYSALFFQDSWKVTPKLTVNWGVRYDYESPRTDRFNQLTNFDFKAASPLQVPGLDLRGGLTFVGVNGQSRYNANPDRNNIAPRLGIAWRALPKTVIRAGGGVFYSATTGIGVAGAFGNSGFQNSTSIVSSLDGVNPIVKWGDPYPNGFNRPTGSSLGLSTLLGQSIQFFDRGNVVPYGLQWNFNIQRELPRDIVVEIGYAGSRGLNFPQNRQWNQIPNDVQRLGDALRRQVPNPFYGHIQVGGLSSRTIAQAQLLRPFPHFSNVSSMNANWAPSTYHALQSKFEKRYASGLTLIASYTFSKLLDIGGVGQFAGEPLSGGARQNWYDLAADWGSSAVDQTHRYILNGVYELPILRGRSGIAAKFLSGWQIGGIWMGFSGGPLGVSSAVNNTFSLGGGQRPNWSGVNPCVANPTPARWLDASVFSVPAAYAFGNAPRTFNGCRGDGTSQVDLTLTKNTRFGERWNLQFRTEAFNISNTPRFAPPVSSFGSPQFGVVNAQSNLPRIVQFGLKLLF